MEVDLGRAGHVSRIRENRWTLRITALTIYEGNISRGRLARRWRDELHDYWKDTIWHRIAQYRQMWKQHSENFVQPRDTTAYFPVIKRVRPDGSIHSYVSGQCVCVYVRASACVCVRGYVRTSNPPVINYFTCAWVWFSNSTALAKFTSVYSVCMCVRACVRACMRARAFLCVRACARSCACVCAFACVCLRA